MTDTIPFLDLITPHRELQPQLMAVLGESLAQAAFIDGPALETFESSFAHYCGVRHCVGVSSGTDALRFALMAAGVQKGDVVITVPNTFIATSEAISQAGGRPQFVDVCERTYTMDPSRLSDYLTRQCRLDAATGRLLTRRDGSPVTAVIPVHLYGQPADMDPILQLARRFNLIVIEDACQAHGAQYFSSQNGCWMKAGSMGDAAAFSFYPGKNLGACGEAGAITTNSEQIARRSKMLRNHGQPQKYFHEIEGYNGRLDAIQAGFLTVKLPHLEAGNQRRREIAARYDELLSDIPGLITPLVPSWAVPVYHLYVIQAEDRKGLQDHLHERGIGTGIHYPLPLHLQEAYASIGHQHGDFPVSEVLAEHALSLPMYPTLQGEQLIRVTDALHEFFAAAHVIPSGR